MPGLGETLRINGRIETLDRNAIELGVEECYVDCAKALNPLRDSRLNGTGS
jgi:uncharacterized protein